MSQFSIFFQGWIAYVSNWVLIAKTRTWELWYKYQVSKFGICTLVCLNNSILSCFFMSWNLNFCALATGHNSNAKIIGLVLSKFKPGPLKHSLHTDSKPPYWLSHWMTLMRCRQSWPCFKINSLIQLSDFHFEDKTVTRQSYLYNVNPYADKTESLYWNRCLNTSKNCSWWQSQVPIAGHHFHPIQPISWDSLTLPCRIYFRNG